MSETDLYRLMQPEAPMRPEAVQVHGIIAQLHEAACQVRTTHTAPSDSPEAYAHAAQLLLSWGMVAAGLQASTGLQVQGAYKKNLEALAHTLRQVLATIESLTGQGSAPPRPPAHGRAWPGLRRRR
jgi:hypothetical protein